MLTCRLQPPTQTVQNMTGKHPATPLTMHRASLCSKNPEMISGGQPKVTQAVNRIEAEAEPLTSLSVSKRYKVGQTST